jgi:hypothetical protein
LQEYFIRHKWNGIALQTESEKEKLILCIIAAIERRVSHVSPIKPSLKVFLLLCHNNVLMVALMYVMVQGLRVDICTQNRMGLLSQVTRVICENGLSIPRVEIGPRGENVVGTFYVTDPSGRQVNPNIVELLRQESGGSADVVTNHNVPCGLSRSSSSSSSSSSGGRENSSVEVKARHSIGSMLWSHFGKISCNFGPIKS